ncbi:sensor histidine kinase [Chitinophagaceae bacterium MMS25-I14]
MKLFTRYNRVNLLVMIVVFLLSSMASYVLLRFVLIHELDEDLYDRKYEIKQYIQHNGKLPFLQNVADEMITCTPATDTVLQFKPRSASLYNPGEEKTTQFRQTGFTVHTGTQYYNITIARPLEGMHGLLRTITLITICTILIIISATILLNTLLLRKLWQPFYDSIATIREFKLGGKKDIRFPETGIDEFAFMNASLEDTIDKAEQDYQLLKEFTENASHEMQTPLAIIRSKLDMLIQEENISEKQSETLKSAYAAIKRLNRLNQSLLLLTKIENHQFALATSIDLEEKIKEKLDQLNEFWQDRNIRVRADLTPATINANPELTDILLNNLFSNASRHNIDHGEIWIQLIQGQLQVHNTGAPRPLDTERLFRRFYKEAQHSQHNGLGLSIVKQICDESGISIIYAYENNRHSFTLTW